MLVQLPAFSAHWTCIARHVEIPLTKADQEDESLNRWKASLGISSSPAIPVDPNDQRRCAIKALALEVEGRPDITIDLTTPGSLQSLKTKPFAIKEGVKFRMKAKFVAQHDVLNGLKYIQIVKRKGIRVGKNEEMIVRYDGFCMSLLVLTMLRALMHLTQRISLSTKKGVGHVFILSKLSY